MTRAALEGIRVLDLSRVLAGPWATQVLGDLGAEVIKVEKPGAGDDTRSWGPPFAAGLQDTAACFMAANRNKRAVMIDMADPEGAGLIRSMVAQCDVLVENYKVGTLARYGLDYESLSAINPALIYCSVTGFGQTGPYASRGGYDFLVQGMGGLMSVTGPAGGEPVKVGVPVIDPFTEISRLRPKIAVSRGQGGGPAGPGMQPGLRLNRRPHGHCGRGCALPARKRATAPVHRLADGTPKPFSRGRGRFVPESVSLGQNGNARWAGQVGWSPSTIPLQARVRRAFSDRDLSRQSG